MDEDKIRELVELKTAESDYSDCYLVELKYNESNNHLTIFMGSDSGMTLEKCQVFSRYLEAYLDESLMLGEKYGLDVSSPGVGSPLRLIRQYQNNIGRDLKVWTTDGKTVKGELSAADEKSITLQVDQGKKKDPEVRKITFDEINKAIVQIKF